MKKFNLILLLALFSISLSCTSDDDNDDDNNIGENFFTLGDDDYALTQGFIEDYGDNGNDSYDFDITLLGDGFEVDFDSEEIRGKGDAIYLDLNSDDMEDLSDGTYVFAQDRDSFTLVDAAVIIDYDIQEETGTQLAVIGGEVILSKSGNDYDITFDLDTQDRRTVTGSYRGSLSRL
ncbi:hypothetical protein [Nonlabens ponticola]|uniref:Uncharacterized protein n=1 Tax=Nonlabens ponticola TaxID=2496866 RepID=A0A3S9MVX7_9FLAO|nr:hypothetical protein [Nonlabens ponticola]AZQ43273.1 hypothetical protein EJ995_03115 [Nonlabens ponticola]